MAALSNALKALIVQRLAMFVADKAIIEELATLGVTVDYPQIAYYHPRTKRSRLGKEWVELFEATRAQYIADTSDIPIAHRAVRLRELNRMFEKGKAAARENVPLQKDLLIEAERFTGDAYTNKRQLTGADGAPLIPATSPVVVNLNGLTTEQLVEFERLTALATTAAADDSPPPDGP